MSVITRQKSNGTIYYAVKFRHLGVTHYQRVGGEKREATRLNDRLKEQRKNNTFRLHAPSKTIRVGALLQRYLPTRKGRAAGNEARLIEMYVLPRSWFASMRVCDVLPPDVKRLIDEVRSEGKLSEKTITNLHSVLSGGFHFAMFESIIVSNPCKALPKGTIVRRKGKKREPYSRAEARKVMACEEQPGGVRMFLYLAFYTGMREGEIVGRRFRDWISQGSPLGALHVHDQYDGLPLKTDDDEMVRPRWVPVHPELEKMLTWWWETGFELEHFRQPTVDDFIVPTLGGRCHARSSCYKAFRRALARASVTNRTLHATRHTFVTVARAESERADLVERITHNKSGTTLDNYTHTEWDTLCKIVQAVDYSVDRATTAGFLGGGPPTRGAAAVAASPVASYQGPVGHRSLVSYLGEELTVRAWADRTGIPAKTLAGRLEAGWPIERALTTQLTANRTRRTSEVRLTDGLFSGNTTVYSNQKTPNKMAPTQGLEERGYDTNPAESTQIHGSLGEDETGPISAGLRSTAADRAACDPKLAKRRGFPKRPPVTV